MKNRLFFLVGVITACLGAAGPAEALDITKTVEGTVVGVSAGSVEVRGDANNMEVAIAVGSDTVYDHVQKLTELKAGDKVQVEYQIKNGKNMAVSVKKLEVETEKGAVL
jgi:hypothetical protein